MGFKARKKLITRKRECSARVGRIRADDWWSGVCQKQRILDLLVESSISGERSYGMIDQQLEPGGNRWKGKTQMI